MSTSKKKSAAAKTAANNKSANKNKISAKNKSVRPSKSETESTLQPWVMNLINDAFWLMSLTVTILIALALLSFNLEDAGWSHGNNHSNQSIHNLVGIGGAYIADISYYLFGLSIWWGWFAACVALYHSFRPFSEHRLNSGHASKPYNIQLGIIGTVLLLIFSPLLEVLLAQQFLQDRLPMGAGGLVGYIGSAELGKYLGLSGSLVLTLTLLIIGLSLLLQISWLILVEIIGTPIEWLWYQLFHKSSEYLTELPNAKNIRRTAQQAKEITSHQIETPATANSNRKAVAVRTAPLPSKLMADQSDNKTTTPAKPTEAGLIQLPDINLLTPVPDHLPLIDTEHLQRTAEQIELRLKEFGVEVEVATATAGPVITRYEIEPAQGVKGSQIVNLNKDLARSLSVQSIRVVETIAGKTTMGIELPNEERQNVLLADILSAPVFTQTEDKLTVAMGKDIAGLPVVASLAKMPHLLVAGTTGSGKSVGVNGMILSILYKAQPDEVRFIMVDPKMLELSVYADIPHLLAPVVTDMREAAQALNWCVAEMEKRYRLLAHVGVRNINGFNDKIIQAQHIGTPLVDPFSENPDEPKPLEKLPFIVVVIDELADLMMVEGKKVEQQIARLAQKARAAGIHLILATQRPSVDVITGLIKANIPTRVSFQVSSKIDSRTILDQMGAENLLGKGDMLFLPPGQAEPTRLHGAFVSDQEVHAIVDYIKQQAPAQYVEGLLTGEAAQSTTNQVNPNANSDELFDQAVAFVLETRKTSISSLQRHLRIGYNRAANLMEALEAAGVVSSAELGGSRRILARKEQ